MESTGASSTKNVTIRYRFGIAEDRKIDRDPGLMETIKAMNRTDAAVLAATILIPSAYGYRIQKSFSSFYFRFGLSAGLLAGSIYAYSRSYARLTGIMIPTPDIKEM